MTRSELTALKRIRAAGFQAAGAGLKSFASVAILAPEDRLNEARAFIKSPSEIVSWRLAEVWRIRFAEAGIVVPGQRERVWVVCGRPA